MFVNQSSLIIIVCRTYISAWSCVIPFTSRVGLAVVCEADRVVGDSSFCKVMQCETSCHWSIVQCENSSDPMTLKIVQCELGIRLPRTQGQFCQERAVPQPTNLVPRNSYRLSPNKSRQNLHWPFYSSRLHSNSESLTLSRHFRGCWASWHQHLLYFNWACFAYGPFSTGWNLKFLHTLGVTDASVSRWARPVLQLWPLGRTISGWNGAYPWLWSAEGRWSRQMPPI